MQGDVATLDKMIADRERLIEEASAELGVLRKARSKLLGESSVIIDHDQLMTTDDAAKLLKIGRSTIHRYISGKVPATKPAFPSAVNSVGRTYMFRRGDLIAWMNGFVLNK